MGEKNLGSTVKHSYYESHVMSGEFCKNPRSAWKIGKQLQVSTEIREMQCKNL